MLRHSFPLHGFWNNLRARLVTPVKCACNLCGVVSRNRMCPRCHELLYVGFGELPEHLIAIVGDKNTGKAHYLAFLVDLILKSHVGHKFNVSIQEVDPTTVWRRWEADIYSADERRYPRPLIFRMDIRFGKQAKSLMLVVFEVESLDEAESAATRYLQHSSGIIYLASPPDVVQFLDGANGHHGVQIDPLPAFIPQVIKAMLPGCTNGDHGVQVAPNGNPPESMLEHVIRAIKEMRGAKGTKAEHQIDVPLAVCISQFDRLEGTSVATGLSARLFDRKQTPVRKGRVDLDAIDAESEAIRDLMVRTGSAFGSLAENAVHACRSVRFFGVSSLGSSFSEREEIHKPNRVEAPFFWILSELGVVKGSRGINGMNLETKGTPAIMSN